jgi:phosphonate transport system permease protein
MSVVGTLLAAMFGLLLAPPASRTWPRDPARWRGASRLLLNALRSVPQLMWAALLLIAAQQDNSGDGVCPAYPFDLIAESP